MAVSEADESMLDFGIVEKKLLVEISHQSQIHSRNEQTTRKKNINFLFFNKSFNFIIKLLMCSEIKGLE
jgi:hypothetical protein